MTRDEAIKTWGPWLATMLCALTLYALDARYSGEDAPKLSEAEQAMPARIEKLYEWHNVWDQNRVPLWYVPRSIEGAMRELTAATQAQTLMLNQMSASFDRLADEVRAR